MGDRGTMWRGERGGGGGGGRVEERWRRFRQELGEEVEAGGIKSLYILFVETIFIKSRGCFYQLHF